MDNWKHIPTLQGEHVRLEPLTLEHVSALQAAAADGELWKLWYTSVPTFEKTQAYVETALAERAAGVSLPFAVRDASGTVVGSTRYGRIERAHRRVEIGWTWYARRVQRTALNTKAKLLLLTHAFETMDAICMQFLANWFNFTSRAAIARLGAKQDGVLRNHMLNPDGSCRDTVVFSIIQSEWPAVKRHLRHKLGREAAA